jgi:hypothetical protein
MIRTLIWLRAPALLLTLVACVAASRPTSAYADAKIYRKLLPSTAWVLSKDGAGAGVLIDAKRRWLVTNEHVVDDQSTVTIFFPEFRDGRPIAEAQHYTQHVERLGIKARVLSTDAKRDLALVELERVPEGIPAVRLAAESPWPGELVHSIGNPGTSHALWIYTSGNVRAVYRKKFNSRKPREMLVVETQSPINPGDSGGPVVNAQGELVGLSHSYDKEARLVSNSVDASEIRALLAEEQAAQELLASARLKVVRQTPRTYAVEAAANGGTHTVYIARATERSGNAQTRRVYALGMSVNGSLSSEVADKVREQNARTTLGAWSVESTSSGTTMVVFSVTADTASPEKLAAVVGYVAKMAASMKQ